MRRDKKKEGAISFNECNYKQRGGTISKNGWCMLILLAFSLLPACNLSKGGEPGPPNSTPGSAVIETVAAFVNLVFDRPVALFVRNRYDIFLFVQPAENEKNIKVGIDYGRKYSNFFLQKNPARLIIYDW